METAKVVETVPLRMQCSECKRFYNAISKPNGEIDGKCPYCHAKYHEHTNAPPLENNTNPDDKLEFVLFFSNEYFGIKVDLDGKKKNQPGV